MAVKVKSAPKKPKATKIPKPGRKMGAEQARNYVFKTYRQTMSLLAKH